MSSDANTFHKGACTQCGGHIEFPTEALGMSISCPHCGTETKLLANLKSAAAPTRTSPEKATKPNLERRAPAPKTGGRGADEAMEPEAAGKYSMECPGCGLEVSIKAETCPGCGAIIKPRSRLNVKMVVISVVVLAAACGGYFVATGKLKPSSIPWPSFAGKGEQPAAPPAGGATAVAPPTPKPVKRSGEFKLVDYQIERVPNRSLVYVVGHVTNDTDKQQFSVRVTFDLFDRNQQPVGTATDYITVIEPGDGWPFRALILDTNAVTAKLQSLDADKQ